MINTRRPIPTAKARKLDSTPQIPEGVGKQDAPLSGGTGNSDKDDKQPKGKWASLLDILRDVIFGKFALLNSGRATGFDFYIQENEDVREAVGRYPTEAFY